MTRQQEFRLGEFRVRPQTRELIGPAGTLRLKPRAMDVLVDLAEHAGRLRTREEVLGAVWGDIAVGEEVLTHCIWELRQALGDDRREPRFIETLHRSGYRLVAPVTESADEETAAPAPERERELALLRQRVQRFWIEQVLEKSLAESEPLTIEREERPELVRHPWGVEPPARAAVPRGESILATFDRMGGALLIVGAVGSGKTVTLLQLARLALERARGDADAPVPVVLPLASWSERALPLQRWITSEIRSRYFLPRELARTWLERGRLLLLLDGLDEVSESRRADCIGAINRFRREVPLASLAVTCREEDYGGSLLELDGAIGLLPLSSSQVTAVLGGAMLEVVVNTPLLLGLARRVLAGESTRSDYEWVQERLFRRLVHDSLRSEGGAGGYSEAEAVRWLSRLARTMLHRNRTLLSVDELQPSWLVATWARVAYVLATRLLIGIWIGAAAACLLGLMARSPALALAVFRDGILGGLGVALLDGLLLSRRQPSGESTLAYAAMAGAAAGSAVLAEHLARGLGALFAAPLFLGLLFALILARPLAAVRFDRDVRAVETLTWSWARALRGWVGVGALTWILLLLGRYWGLWPARARQGAALLSTLPNSMFFAMVPAMLLGLEPGVVDAKTRPNHGIWLSARNAALSGGLTLLGCFVSVVAGWLLALRGWLGSVQVLRTAELHPDALLFVAVGGCFAPLAALRFGGLDILKHCVLRLLLWRQGLCPLFFPRFLEHATRRGLLRRAGGGYLFFHSTLMAYLAGAEATWAADYTEAGGSR